MRRPLLACGILASLLYVGADVFGAISWRGYSFTDQTVSELSAIGAPTRALVVPFFLAYAPLVVAFGVGVWKSAGGMRALRITGALLAAFGIICATGPFTPMHQRAVLAATGPTLTDTLHKLSAAVDVLFIVLIIAFAATAFGRRFRAYSIATIVLFLVPGVLGAIAAPRVEANLPTPWLGIEERVSIYAFQLWALVLAALLFGKNAPQSPIDLRIGQ